MRTVAWLGPLILIVGLILGAFMARGMYVVEENTRARITPVAEGPVQPPVPVILQVGAGDSVHGRPVFEQICSDCHGMNGKGDVPLHGPLLNVYYPDDKLLAGIIRNGVGEMPAYPPDKLSDRDVADVIAFIRALR